ncbi:MAG: MarR family transcriptional regulator [Clostridia bacterium]
MSTLHNLTDLVQSYFDLVERLPRLIDNEGIAREVGLTASQAFVLHYLRTKGSQRASDLAKVVGLTSSAITQICDSLEQMDAIARERMQEDRRTVLISITARGRELIAELYRARARRMTDTLNEMSQDEVKELIRIIKGAAELMELRLEKDNR